MTNRLTSTMQEVPLSIGSIVRYGTSAYSDTSVRSYDGQKSTSTTLGAMGRRAARLAHGLRERLDVREGEPVGTLMWNTTEHFELYLSVPAMGAVLHTLNVRYTAEQITFTATHAGDRVIVVDADLLSQLLALASEMPDLEHIVVVGDTGDDTGPAPSGVAVHEYEDLLDNMPDSFDWPELPEDSPALMCYTSGTTGAPKGIVYSHRSVYLASMQLCMGDYLALSVADRILLSVPMFHANSWNFPYAALLVGAGIVLPGRHVQAGHLARLIDSERPTISAGVPTIWSDLLELMKTEPTDLSSLRDVVIGGSACPRWLMETYQREFGIRLLHGWGMTEMSPYGTIAKDDGIDEPDQAWEVRLSQGRFLGSVQARVMAADGTLGPHDGTTVGEIQTRGPWVTGSYHRGQSPESFDDGWLRTGDVGTISPDGVLRLTDRTKDVIKSGGEWISSIELEDAILTHPAVIEAAVIGVQDERWGERPLVVVRLADEAGDTSVDMLVEHLAAEVERWKLPERWVLLEELPRTSVGKTDKSALRQYYADNRMRIERWAEG